jgi:hypothetical protein
LVSTQFILLSLWFSKNNLFKKHSKKNQPKRPSQNGWVQIELLKITLWSSWTWGQKNHMRVFLLKFLVKKVVIFSSDHQLPIRITIATLVRI